MNYDKFIGLTEPRKSIHEISQGGANALKTTRTSATTLSSPGDIAICSKDFFYGDCTYFNALGNVCVILPKEIQRHARSIHQAKGAICTYHAVYNGKYCGEDIGYLIQQGEHDKDTVLNLVAPTYSDYITSVTCRRIDSAAMETPELTEVFLEKRDDATFGAVSEILGTPGAVKAFTAERFQGNYNLVNAMNTCVALTQGRTWKHARSIIQYQGGLCTYYTDEHGCSSPRMIAGTPFHDEEMPILDPFVADFITHIRCEPYGATQAAFVQFVGETEGKRDAVDGPHSAAYDEHTPGSVEICTNDDLKGSCASFETLNKCTELSETRKAVHSLRQGLGATCEYHADAQNRSTVHFKLDSPLWESYWPKVPQVDAESIARVCCVPFTYKDPNPKPPTEQTKESRSSKTSDAMQSAPSSGLVLVSAQESLAGSTQLVSTVNDDNNCAPLHNQFFWHLYSLRQYKGAVCTYWQYNCGNLSHENKPLFTVDSRNGDIVYDKIPEGYGENRHKVSYIRCNRYSAATSDSAESWQDASPDTRELSSTSSSGSTLACRAKYTGWVRVTSQEQYTGKLQDMEVETKECARQCSPPERPVHLSMAGNYMQLLEDHML